MTRRQVIKFVALGALALAVPLGIAWWQFTRPHVYRRAASPDGSWSLTVLRQRVFPYVDGVDVIAEVRDAGGRVRRREKIGYEDWWGDVDEKYPAVECSNDAARVSRPEGWPKAEDWVVRKTDVLADNAS